MMEKVSCCNNPCSCDNPCSSGVCRRDFIKIALAAGFLAGCSPRMQATTEPTAAPTQAPAEPSPVPTATPVPPPAVHWPTDGWRTSTPEEQGIDSEPLVRMLEFIRDQSYQFEEMNDLLVIRNGHVVLDACLSPSVKDITQELFCAGRSVVSALVGIAIAKGHIDGVDQPLLSFFPERTVANNDPRKEAITLEHLLTNTTGLRGGGPGDAEGDLIQEILDRPMVTDPGTNFGFYPGSYLSSAVLQTATGTDALTFAREHLFGPLGISDASWETDSDGLCTPTGLQLTAHDLARFGHLYLNDGTWDGRQIVPAEWVTASLQRYSSTGCNLGFGYQWWIHGFGAYAAQSGRAQSFAVQDLGLLTVSTSQPGGGQARIASLVEFFIMPAAKSSEPLPENPAAVAQMESLVKELERPAES